jgi:hypothetical protein
MLYCSKTEIPNGWVLTGVKGGVEQQRPILRRSVQDGEGARGFDAQIRAKGECVSARALVNEMLSSSKVGCISVAYSQVASNRGRQRYCTLALWGPWYRRPKQRTQLHTTAMPLLQGPLRLPVAAEAVVVAVVREEGGLTHRATRKAQPRLGCHNSWCGVEDRRWGVRSGCLLRCAQQTWAEAALEGAALVTQVCLL